MLTPAEFERIAVNLAKIRLDPVTYFAVVGAVADALVETTYSREHASAGDGATPPAPQRKPGRPRRVDASHTDPPSQPASAPDDSKKREINTPPAVSFLRGCLALRPMPASHVEELAQKKGIPVTELERAKQTLGVTVARFDGGRGVCFCLPSQAADAETAEA